MDNELLQRLGFIGESVKPEAVEKAARKLNENDLARIKAADERLKRRWERNLENAGK